MAGPRIALTAGEPAGVGPELCLMLAARSLPCELVCLADRELLAARARSLRLAVTLLPYTGEGRPHRPGSLVVEHHALATPSLPGQLDPRNAAHVLALLDRACAGALAGEFAAMVTAPVHKGVISEAGRPFTGHTEYLAERCGGAHPVMMLAAPGLRVALATTHLPLAAVSPAITEDRLLATLRIVQQDLQRWWGIKSPRIAVLGLNPHAGEGGHLGDEEIRVITPALQRAAALGLTVTGPLPADTAFLPSRLAGVDAVLAMYHDQGLPVIKHVAFDSAVNITLGLPILRTSVDHGTALDLAGSGRADPASLAAALELAISLRARTGD
jgi:4-hydroxythreonine-4-phosphate dehydrogenase